MANTYTLISKTTLASIATSVFFNAIPQTYSDLVVRWNAKTTVSGQTSTSYRIILNENTTSIYSGTYLEGGNSTSTSYLYQSASNFSSNSPTILPGGAATTGIFGSLEMYIPNYAGSTAKPIQLRGAYMDPPLGTAYTQSLSTAHLFNSTAAITAIRLRLQLTTDNFAIGSSFYLYGIKNT